MLSTAILIAFVLVGLGLVATVVRMLLGPSRADRVVALDLVTVQLVALSALLALSSANSAFLDLSLVLALIGFLATVAFARYLESGPEPTGNGPRVHKEAHPELRGHAQNEAQNETQNVAHDGVHGS